MRELLELKTPSVCCDDRRAACVDERHAAFSLVRRRAAAGRRAFSPPPLCQRTSQPLLLLACGLDWQRVDMPELQIDPPGRALRSQSSYPGEAAGEARVGRNARGRMKTGRGQLLAHLPAPLHLPSTSPFCFLLSIYLF